jgi:hypothetical protein
MPVNLDRTALTVEKYMIDEIKLYDTEVYGEGLETTKGRHLKYQGKAMVSASGTPARTNRGGRDITTLYYEVMIPKNQPFDIPEFGEIVVTASGDVSLVGQTLVITGSIPGTYTVATRLNAYMEEPSP